MDKRLKLAKATAQIVLKYLIDGQPSENVFYVQNKHRNTPIDAYAAQDMTDAHAASIAGRVRDWVTGSWQAVAAQSAGVTEIQVVYNTGDPGVGPLAGHVLSDSSFPYNGGVTGENLPNNCTVAMSIRTALLGRAYHGRLYHVGLSRSDVDSGAPNVLNTAAQANLLSAYADLMSRLAADSSSLGESNQYPLGVSSFYLSHVLRTAAIWTPATAMTLTDTAIDSMRRRLPLHNRHR